MKITDVRCKLISRPVPENKRRRCDYGWQVKCDHSFVEVCTDDGIVGYGVAFGHPLSMKTITEGPLRDMLLGEDPTDIERLWHKMYCGSRGDVSLKKGHTMPIVSNRGEMVCALSGIDMALWDIMGKYLNQPLYKLLGACRDKVRCYASGGWEVADKIGEELLSYTAHGFDAVKMRAEGKEGSFTLRGSLARVKAAREALGPDIEIFIDGHASLDVATAVKYCNEIEQYDIGWLEEPISQDDNTGLAYVRHKVNVPIATGERLCTRFDFLTLMRLDCVDYIQPDLGICGGFTEGRRIGALAASFGVKLASHNWGNPLLTAASIHYALSQPTYYIYEFCHAEGETILLKDAFTKPLDVRDGYLYPSALPGIGVEFAPDFFAKYPYIPGPEWVY